MKKYFFILFFILIAGDVFAGTTSLTTYYPPPTAAYNKIKLSTSIIASFTSASNCQASDTNTTIFLDSNG
ncbi:MAG: hypothetical protein HQL12_08980, partial [Candidatus Omnitrophica bacterium]|nr:hypothetical protein [Candidatus Omnitrophota bacterium]